MSLRSSSSAAFYAKHSSRSHCVVSGLMAGPQAVVCPEIVRALMVYHSIDMVTGLVTLREPLRGSLRSRRMTQSIVIQGKNDWKL